jgi:hypothetical protein
MDICPGVAPIVHLVIYQPGMPFGRDTLAGGIKIGFIGNRVLKVTEVISKVC